MSDSIFDFVLRGLQSTKGSWPAVASGSGVPLRTLEKIARGEISNPGVMHIERLAKYFRESNSDSQALSRAGTFLPEGVTTRGTQP